jgi:2-polyprenyl-3-methyl-5-hydroxy-6-metoxy-1,4-benzoquinol methylase
MMFGTGERFRYFQCAACSCLQIESVPDDMARHYPENYYSFSEKQTALEPGWRKWLKTQRVKSALEGRGVVDGLLAPIIHFPADIRLWSSALALTQSSRILDVGCGGGDLLRRMARLGFTSLRGADPFVASDLDYPDGVRIFKKALADLQGEFDVIMLHHSFEHMPEQQAVLANVKRLLAPGGAALVRIPLVSCEAYREYGLDWVQLDAPRHFYLHSEKSMGLLVEQTGFRVERVVYDSTAFQFWGSEQYRRDIALFAPNSEAVNPQRSLFSRAEIAAWEARARELNERHAGDQACFVLRAASS